MLSHAYPYRVTLSNGFRIECVSLDAALALGQPNTTTHVGEPVEFDSTTRSGPRSLPTLPELEPGGARLSQVGEEPAPRRKPGPKPGKSRKAASPDVPGFVANLDAKGRAIFTALANAPPGGMRTAALVGAAGYPSSIMGPLGRGLTGLAKKFALGASPLLSEKGSPREGGSRYWIDQAYADAIREALGSQEGEVPAEANGQEMAEVG